MSATRFIEALKTAELDFQNDPVLIGTVKGIPGFGVIKVTDEVLTGTADAAIGIRVVLSTGQSVLYGVNGSGNWFAVGSG